MKPSQLILPLAACLFAALPAARARAQQPPPCKAYQLSLNTDSENGAFNGMSHSGTLLVLRNLGPNACTVPARPVVAFQDARRHTLPATLQTPRGMHPGPVLVPVVIPAQAEVTSRMRWVSSDAYDAHNKIAPAFIAVRIAAHTLRHKFTGQLFGPAHKHPSYTATPFRSDPTYAQPCPSPPAKPSLNMNLIPAKPAPKPAPNPTAPW